MEHTKYGIIVAQSVTAPESGMKVVVYGETTTWTDTIRRIDSEGYDKGLWLAGFGWINETTMQTKEWWSVKTLEVQLYDDSSISYTLMYSQWEMVIKEGLVGGVKVKFDILAGNDITISRTDGTYDVSTGQPKQMAQVISNFGDKRPTMHPDHAGVLVSFNTVISDEEAIKMPRAVRLMLAHGTYGALGNPTMRQPIPHPLVVKGRLYRTAMAFSDHGIMNTFLATRPKFALLAEQNGVVYVAHVEDRGLSMEDIDKAFNETPCPTYDPVR